MRDEGEWEGGRESGREGEWEGGKREWCHLRQLLSPEILSLLLVYVLHQDTLVLEHISLHLKVEPMVPGECVSECVCVSVCVSGSVSVKTLNTAAILSSLLLYSYHITVLTSGSQSSWSLCTCEAVFAVSSSSASRSPSPAYVHWLSLFSCHSLQGNNETVQYSTVQLVR